jgi:hypothetical protein
MWALRKYAKYAKKLHIANKNRDVKIGDPKTPHIAYLKKALRREMIVF